MDEVEDITDKNKEETSMRKLQHCEKMQAAGKGSKYSLAL
jgi:hypothetical protein